MTQTTTIKAGDSAKTITLAEGQSMSIVGGAGALGTAYLLDAALGGMNPVKSWAIGSGSLASAIGPYANTQKIHITCLVGSIEATTQDAVLTQSGGAITATITGTGIVGQPLTATLPTGYVATLQFTRSTKATTPVKTNIAGAVANAVNSLSYTPVTGDTVYNIGCDTSNVVAPSATVSVSAAPVAAGTLRNVGVRCQYPDTLLGGVQQMSKTYEPLILDRPTDALSLVYTNFTNQLEVSNPSALTIRVGIEYEGQYAVIKWGGSTTGSIPSGAELESDLTPLGFTLPAGKVNLTLWTYMASANGTPTARGSVREMTFDNSVEALFTSGTVSPSIDLIDATPAERAAINVGDTSTDLAIHYCAKPVAIKAMSSLITVVGIGDSRSAIASNDYINDTNYLSGPIERIFGKVYATMNLSALAEKGRTWVAGAQGLKRRLLVRHAGPDFILFYNDGTNDSPAESEASLIALDAQFAAIPELAVASKRTRGTIPAQSAKVGTYDDFGATVANQAGTGNPANHVALNTARRDNTDGAFDYCFDFAQYTNVDQTADTRWKAHPSGRGRSGLLGSMTSGSNIVTLDPATAAGDQFAAGDVGLNIFVGQSGGVGGPGNIAGTAVYKGRILAILDGFRCTCTRYESKVVNMTKNASSNKSGVPVAIGAGAFTQDFIHETTGAGEACQEALQLQTRVFG